MSAACSTDIRGRVITSVESGSSRREAAEEIDVSPSSAIKWVAITERLEAGRPSRGAGALTTGEARELFLTLIERQSDLTLDEVTVCCESKEFAVVALRCGASSSGTTLRSKKTLHAAEQQRADVARARRRWMRAQGMFDPAHLVFLDETAANTKMMRVGGRCLRGERLIGQVPHGHWKTITSSALYAARE